MSHLLSFLMSNVFSAVAGGFLGYHLCVYISHRKGLDVTDEQTSHQVRNGIAVILASLAIVGLGFTFAVGQYQRASEADDTAKQFKAEQQRTDQRFAEFRACVNHYTTLQAEATRARSIAGEELDKARQGVFDAHASLFSLVAKAFTSGHQVSPDAWQHALGTVLSASAHEKSVLRHLQVERAQHPYPVPPKVACR